MLSFANTYKDDLTTESATDGAFSASRMASWKNMFFLSIGSESKYQADCTTGCIHGGACDIQLLSRQQISEEAVPRWQPYGR